MSKRIKSGGHLPLGLVAHGYLVHARASANAAMSHCTVKAFLLRVVGAAGAVADDVRLTRQTLVCALVAAMSDTTEEFAALLGSPTPPPPVEAADDFFSGVAPPPAPAVPAAAIRVAMALAQINPLIDCNAILVKVGDGLNKRQCDHIVDTCAQGTGKGAFLCATQNSLERTVVDGLRATDCPVNFVLPALWNDLYGDIFKYDPATGEMFMYDNSAWIVVEDSVIARTFEFEAMLTVVEHVRTFDDEARALHHVSGSDARAASKFTTNLGNIRTALSSQTKKLVKKVKGAVTVDGFAETVHTAKPAVAFADGTVLDFSPAAVEALQETVYVGSVPVPAGKEHITESEFIRRLTRPGRPGDHLGFRLPHAWSDVGGDALSQDVAAAVARIEAGDKLSMPDDATRGWWRMWRAYAFLPRNIMDAFMFLTGPGGDGKTTDQERQANALGKKAFRIAQELLTKQKHGGDRGRARADLVAMVGVLMAYTSEVEDQIDPASIKAMTEFLMARSLYANVYNKVHPSFKPEVALNTMMRFFDLSDGTARRVFNVIFKTVPVADRDASYRQLCATNPDYGAAQLSLEFRGDGTVSPFYRVVVGVGDDPTQGDFLADANLAPEVKTSTLAFREQVNPVKSFVAETVEVGNAADAVLLGKGCGGRGVFDRALAWWAEQTEAENCNPFAGAQRKVEAAFKREVALLKPPGAAFPAFVTNVNATINGQPSQSAGFKGIKWK